MAKHPRTAMIDLLEDIRAAIKLRDPSITSAQVLAVLASAMEDVVSPAFQELSAPTKDYAHDTRRLSCPSERHTVRSEERLPMTSA